MQHRQCKIPALPAGLRYVACAAGWEHSLLVRDDGHALAFGSNVERQCEIPALPPGVRYVGCAAGDEHSLLLRDAGLKDSVAERPNPSNLCTSEFAQNC